MNRNDLESFACDVDFSHAIKKAGRGSPEELIEFLRSERFIGRGERLALADLVAGEWRSRRGRRSNLKKKLEMRDAEAVVNERFQRYKAAGHNRVLDSVIDEVAEELGIDPQSLSEWKNRSNNRK